ncbi:MAG: hypothetical protein HRT88_22130 [Lentisphaeraceae bacterium]|nr:hypothetical protein [Lentisphaeraceae bacterium]
MKFIRKYFYTICPIIGILVIGILFCRTYFATNGEPKILISIIVVILSILYFVQKQKLEKEKLFFDAFKDFNYRFSLLNADLIDLPKEGKCKESEERIIRKYFDLCAEEYYFFKHNILPLEVWEAWAIGIYYYLSNYNCIKDYWREVEKSSSSYGLNIIEIEKYNKKLETDLGTRSSLPNRSA